MYKIAILGCENSHAWGFMTAIAVDKTADVEVVGAYTEYPKRAEDFHRDFGVYMMKSYDELVGQVDGVVITARDGKNHYKYAKPYIESGIPMFIDKPITNSEEDAKAFKAELKAHNIKISGGTSIVLCEMITDLEKGIKENKYGKIYSGFLRAPVYMNSEYGGFFFYAQHLVQMATHLFGCFPKAVKAYPNGDSYVCVLRYEDKDITLNFVEANNVYHACISAEKGVFHKDYVASDALYAVEFMEYYKLFSQEEKGADYDAFFAPVYIMNAIMRSLESGKEETITYEA